MLMFSVGGSGTIGLAQEVICRPDLTADWGAVESSDMPEVQAAYALPLVFFAEGQEFLQGSFGTNDAPAPGLRLFNAQFERSTAPNDALFHGYLGPLVGAAIGQVGFVTNTASVQPANGYQDSVYGMFQIPGQRVCLFRLGTTSADGVVRVAGRANSDDGSNNSAVFCNGEIVLVGSYDGKIWHLELDGLRPWQDAAAVPELLPEVLDASGSAITLAVVSIVQASDGTIYAGLSSQGGMSVVMRRGGLTTTGIHSVVWTVEDLGPLFAGGSIINAHLVSMCAADGGSVIVATDGNDPKLGPMLPVFEIGPSGALWVSDGLPTGVRCADLEYNQENSTVYLATCGRSLWSLRR
jgi:hypothetical protein